MMLLASVAIDRRPPTAINPARDKRSSNAVGGSATVDAPVTPTVISVTGAFRKVKLGTPVVSSTDTRRVGFVSPTK
jgi:hypothetical protein